MQSDYSNQVVDRQTEEPINWHCYGSQVTKIVLGNCPTDDDGTPISVRLLPADFAERFPVLTHLHLWKIQDLEELPPLPGSLRCLDVRGCENLRQLGELPDGLETLDIGDCSRLAKLPYEAPRAIKRFYFERCESLSTRVLENLLASMREREIPVVEIRGSHNSSVTSLREFPSAVLKKLVLDGCEQLADVEGLESFDRLEHLDLQRCSKLSVLPKIPTSLRFLALHGAENLTSFLGQSIGPYDRGNQGQNVAAIFHTRRKFGSDLAVMPHAKLLLMGDGRVGKTTLAKRLQWEELDAAAREQPAGQSYQPRHNEPFSHGVQFWHWKTGLALAGDRVANLQDHAATAEVQIPTSDDGLLEGGVRIWDFGGQEIYHNTHRIFASEGAIFLVVWQADEPEYGDPPQDVTAEEWLEWNRQRSLDYWLDYIFDMRPDARVALVCAKCKNPDQMEFQPNWKERAPRHKQRDLDCFFVDSLDENCGQHGDFRGLVNWIRGACGNEADRIGIVQPTFFRTVSDQVDAWLEQNSQARCADLKAEHLLVEWDDWRQSVITAHQQHSSSEPVELDESDIVTITDYLHDAGHLFKVDHPENRAVIVDQEWAADLIYQLLKPGDAFRNNVKGTCGIFYLSTLENDARWRALQDDTQRARFLEYMEQCRTITKLGDRNSHRLGEDVYLALDKWLLPPYESVEEKVEQRMNFVLSKPAMESKKFDFQDAAISEFEFRGLQEQLARFFKTRGVYFRSGLQARDRSGSDWCFRIRWTPDLEGAFMGKIDAVMVARSEQIESMLMQIEDVLYTDDGPFAQAGKPVSRRHADKCDLTHEFFRSLRTDEYDVAVSSCGADAADVETMLASLGQAGFAVNWYRFEDCRHDDRRGVLDFMNSLNRQDCIILLLSADYLRDDPHNNWYCPWELAQAILQIHRNARSVEQTIVVFKSSDRFQFSSFNEVARKLFTNMAKFFNNAYADLPFTDKRKFKHYHDFMQDFADAIESNAWDTFFKAHGSLGFAIDYNNLATTATGQKDFQPVIKALERAGAKRSLRVV